MEKPNAIQRLDSKTYAFNYNITENTRTNEDGEEETYYEYDQVVVNCSEVSSNDVVKNTLLDNFDRDYQLKLINDYKSYELGILTDESCKTRYEDFLQFRADVKNTIDETVEE